MSALVSASLYHLSVDLYANSL